MGRLSARLVLARHLLTDEIRQICHVVLGVGRHRRKDLFLFGRIGRRILGGLGGETGKQRNGKHARDEVRCSEASRHGRGWVQQELYHSAGRFTRETKSPRRGSTRCVDAIYSLARQRAVSAASVRSA